MQDHTSTKNPSEILDNKSLEDENRQLRRQLKTFMHNGRINEEKLYRLQALELRLIRCSSLTDYLDTVLKEYRETAQLDQVSLILLDPTFEIRKIVSEDRLENRYSSNLHFVDRRNELEEGYAIRSYTYLGPYQNNKHQLIFRKKHGNIASVAILPLYQQHKLVGALCLGSIQKDRFIEGTASDLLERFSQIVTACLSNMVNAERLRRLGLTDPLTGVNNRRFFDQRLFEEVGQSQRNQKPLCCLFFDVDHFKRVNDRHGHEAGDIVLKEVATIIRMNLRASDVLSRYGGEEFAALLLQTGSDKAKEIGERTRRSIENTLFNFTDKKSLKVNISIGLAVLENFPADYTKMDTEQLASDLINTADEYLYHAKRTGRNRVVAGSLFDKTDLITVTDTKEKGDAARQHRLFD